MGFPLGQPVRLTFLTFSDPAQTTLADPTTVSVDVKAPDGTVATYTLAASQVVRDSLGTFHYDVTTVAGHYEYHWFSTGAVTTSEDGSFDVDPEYGTSNLVSLQDFALLLGNPTVATDPRASFILGLAQEKCETIVTPLPTGARSVILDVAERAYANPVNAGGSNLGLYTEGEGPLSDASPGTVGGGLYLTQSNIQELRRLAGSGGAFTIDTMPATAGQGLPWWDTAATLAGDWDVPS